MNNKRIELWVDAFKDEEFQKRLQEYRNEIEIEIIKIAETYHKSGIMMFDSVESRIKSVASFEQKLSRKDYINKWIVDNDKQINQNYILNNLSDVIGFRISCYFIADEHRIYQRLLKETPKDITFFDAKKRMQNGQVIYKVDGVYSDKCRFEIQIKSLVNNVWGEVDHRTLYKTREYDCNIEDRIAITSGACKVLTAADAQLNTLFEMTYGVDKLIKGLFYEYTRDHLKDRYNTDILGKAYWQFFGVFYNSYKDAIREFVANKLLGNNVAKKRIERVSSVFDLQGYKEVICDKYLRYDIDLMKSVSEEVFEYADDDTFLDFFIINLIRLGDDGERYGDEDAFSYEEDEQPDDENKKYQVLFGKMEAFKFTEVEEK